MHAASISNESQPRKAQEKNCKRMPERKGNEKETKCTDRWVCNESMWKTSSTQETLVCQKQRTKTLAR
jgi:hypothetical protein